MQPLPPTCEDRPKGVLTCAFAYSPVPVVSRRFPVVRGTDAGRPGRRLPRNALAVAPSRGTFCDTTPRSIR